MKIMKKKHVVLISNQQAVVSYCRATIALMELTSRNTPTLSVVGSEKDFLRLVEIIKPSLVITDGSSDENNAKGPEHSRSVLPIYWCTACGVRWIGCIDHKVSLTERIRQFIIWRILWKMRFISNEKAYELSMPVHHLDLTCGVMPPGFTVEIIVSAIAAGKL
jgi:hypothetical protein